MDLGIVKLKKIIFIFCLLSICLYQFSYAKDNPFAEEVDKPVAVPKNNYSNGTIYHKDSFEVFSPINPVEPGVNKEEYDSVDNYNIDLNTLGIRIKYFSPIYKNIKANAESSLWMSLYARGGHPDIASGYKDYSAEARGNMDSRKDERDVIKSYLSKLNPGDVEYPSVLAQYVLAESEYAYAKNNYNYENAIMTFTIGKVGMKKEMNRIANVDNMTQIVAGRDKITNMLSNTILLYLKINSQVDILAKQEKIYKDMYNLTLKNYELGTQTALDVSESLDNYENVKNQLKNLKNNVKNVKEQIALNLGYSITDIDKLNFIEPEVNMSYVENVNIDEDRDKAYNSNSTYVSIKLDANSKKYPGSDGEKIYNQRKRYISEKVIIALEDLYSKMQAALISYQSSYYLAQICELNDIGNKIKLDTKLVSELEYDALELQNLANKLAVKVAKYDLITAINNYYYGTMGQIVVS